MDLTLTDFVLIVLLGSGALVVIAGWLSRSTHRRERKQAMAHRVICRICLSAFIEESDQRVVACPQCHSLNEKSQRANR